MFFGKNQLGIVHKVEPLDFYKREKMAVSARKPLTPALVRGMLNMLGRSGRPPIFYSGRMDDPMKTFYHNGRVYTGKLPLASCFTVEDGKFLSVGEESPDADVRVDLQGAFVCPGFIDSLMHLLGLGQTQTIAMLHQLQDVIVVILVLVNL